MVAFARPFLGALLSPSSKHPGSFLEAAFSGRIPLEGELILKPTADVSRSSNRSVATNSSSANQTHQLGEGENDELPTFSLHDWTLAFRKSVQLASRLPEDVNLNITLTLTPGVDASPPAPYSMSTVGVRHEENLDNLSMRVVVDPERGELLMEKTTNAHFDTRSNESGPKQELINATANISEEDVVLTTADWLMRPSEKPVSISRHLETYLHGLVAEQRESQEGNSTEFRDRVDYAISLVSTVDMGLESTTTTSSCNDSVVVQKSAHVRAFAPSFFADLRRSFGIHEHEYWMSLIDESLPFVSFQSNSKGARRVGGLFFFSRDGTYMIKTVKSDEATTLLDSFLLKYGHYMKQNGRDSLLSRCCGLYQVQLSATKRVNGTFTKEEKSRVHTFVVLNAVFPPYLSRSIAERFDLKGSTLGRHCSPEEIKSKGSFAVLKDMDLMEEVNKTRSSQILSGQNLLPFDSGSSASSFATRDGLHIGPVAKSNILAQLRKDVELLVACKTIDYSLLVGVNKRERPVFDFLSSLFDGNVGGASSPTYEPIMDSGEPSWFSQIDRNIRLMFGPVFYWKTSRHDSVQKMLQTGTLFFNNQWEQCGVNCGPLSILPGERRGNACVFYFGLIDFLQPYNAKKEAEYQWKSLRYGRKSGFSCIPPRPYADRFLAFLDRHIT